MKDTILQILQQDGFYLLDLSELPLSLLDTGLQSQLPSLVDKINSVVDDNTQIILIKTNVYDIAFYYLKQKFKNIVDQRITFPGRGGQRKFQDEFKQALKKFITLTKLDNKICQSPTSVTIAQSPNLQKSRNVSGILKPSEKGFYCSSIFDSVFRIAYIEDKGSVKTAFYAAKAL